MKNKEKYFKDTHNWFKDKDTEKIDYCIVCHSPVRDRDNKYKTNEIAQCVCCGFVFRRFQPTNEVLNDFYNNSNPMKQWANIKQTKFESIRQTSKFNYISNFIENNNINSVLDYGCGNGFFFSMLSNKIQKIGLEPNIDASMIAESKFKLIPNLNELKENVDFISMFGVLEHLKDPHQTLVELKEKLNNKGYLGIIVPNVDSLIVKLLKEKTSTFCPQHLWYFNINTLIALLKDHGFDIIDYRTIESEIDPILRILNNKDPYDSSIKYKDAERSSLILANGLGYKIVAIFKKRG